MGLFSGPGVTPSLKGNASNLISLPAGGVYNVPSGEAGWYMLHMGRYTAFQSFDPILQAWGSVGGEAIRGGRQYVYMDGTTNYRFANQTGAVVGALITNAGSGYTSAPTVTASAGGSIWRAIVGGAVNTSVTISNGGANYTYPPLIVISAPPSGGIQATATCTISGGVVNAITVTNQGAGYNAPPTFSFINDPREGANNTTVGYNAAAVCTLTGAGTVTGLICVDHGQGGLTSLPTLSFSGGGGSSAAATAIMCWSITAYAVSTAGTAVSGAFARVTAEDKFPTTSPAYTNPSTQSGLVKVRNADIKAPTSGNGITATGQVVYDGGIYTSAPEPLVLCTASVIATAPVITLTMGGFSDTSYYCPV